MSIRHLSEVSFGDGQPVPFEDAQASIAALIAPLIASLAAHEIEVAALVGLQDGPVEQMRVAAFGPIRGPRKLQGGAALFEFGGIDQEIDASLGDIEPD